MNGAGAQGDDGKGERPADNRWMDTKTGREERDRWTGNRESGEERDLDIIRLDPIMTDSIRAIL